MADLQEWSCGGDGIVYGEEVVTVKIPAGVGQGMQFSMTGKGNAGKHNGVSGDLIIAIDEEPNAELVRDGNNVVYNLLLSFPTAAIGGNVEIPTIDGHDLRPLLLILRATYQGLWVGVRYCFPNDWNHRSALSIKYLSTP